MFAAVITCDQPILQGMLFLLVRSEFDLPQQGVADLCQRITQTLQLLLTRHYRYW